MLFVVPLSKHSTLIPYPLIAYYSVGLKSLYSRIPSVICSSNPCLSSKCWDLRYQCVVDLGCRPIFIGIDKRSIPLDCQGNYGRHKTIFRCSEFVLLRLKNHLNISCCILSQSKVKIWKKLFVICLQNEQNGSNVGFNQSQALICRSRLLLYAIRHAYILAFRERSLHCRRRQCVIGRWKKF